MQNVGSSYVAQDLLGGGAIGEVWRGTDREGNPVAIKILRAEYSRKRDVVRRFIQERELLTDLDHAHVVTVHDLVYDNSTLAIVMDLIDGGDLAGLLHRTGPLDAERMRMIAADIASGLAAIHAADIVHLDLKPGNVLLRGADAGGAALIADLGVSQLTRGPTGVAEHPRFGTPQYTAPEIVTGGAVGSEADVYALGLLMIEMLRGQPVFPVDADAIETLDAQVTQEFERPAAADDALWALISSLVAKDPEDRPTALIAAAELGVPREQLGTSALHEDAQPAEVPAEEGVDRPLFPVSYDPFRTPSPTPTPTAPKDGAATQALGHRTTFLRSAQTVAFDQNGPRTRMLPSPSTTQLPPPGTAHPREPTDLPGGTREVEGRRRRWPLVAGGSFLLVAALVVAALIWLPGSPAPQPPTTGSTEPTPTQETLTGTPTESETPTTASADGEITVADVTGMTEQAARQEIHGGLRVEIVSVVGTDAQPGTVVRTAPEAGSPIAAGETVTLEVARETATQPLTDLTANATDGRAEVDSIDAGGTTSPGALVLTGDEGIARTDVLLQKRYLALDAGLAVPDSGNPVQVQIQLDQVPVLDETIEPGQSVPISLDVAEAQTLTVTVTSTSGGAAQVGLTSPTLSGEKGRVPGS